ncbi:MAG: hypothetical protein IKG42_00265 [Clostridia bacterium]|nr:hypothetical protein [Clostridia bacterium]
MLFFFEFRSDKGITLIALVITIIVLLILASITIVMIVGENGILSRTNEAKQSMSDAEDLEKIKIATTGSYDENGVNTVLLSKNLSQINGLTNNENAVILENTEISLPLVVKLNENKYLIHQDGEVTKFYEQYSQDGLVLHLDGINNTRNGHSSNTTTWEDLSGNNNDFIKRDIASDPIWSENSYVGDNTNRALILRSAILAGSAECTVEVCYDVPIIKNYYWIFQSRQSNYGANGFQFVVENIGRNIHTFVNYTTYHHLANSINEKSLNKKTMAFTLDNKQITFSDNASFYSEDSKEGIIESIMNRNCYTIGSAYPWREDNKPINFIGNIYSIRVYNRKLTESELENNYLVDKVRFNMQ